MIRLRRRKNVREATETLTMPRDERLIAVGSLSGLPPGEIAGYVLIAMGDDGMMSLSGDQCSHGRMLLLASAMRRTAGEVIAEGHGGHS